MNALRALAFAAFFVCTTAQAQNLRVLTVPAVGDDPSFPHVAYNGHATTFKAIARGGDGTYSYEWDFQGDGVYDFSATTSNRYNLSARFTYPLQLTTTTFNAKLRVTSGGQTVTGIYPVRVDPTIPASPVSANLRQLQLMRAVAADDGLWFLHTQMTRIGNEEDPVTGSQSMGYTAAGFNPELGGSTFLEALARQGHRIAYPPSYLGQLPAGNDQRWRDDPYAEDAMRLVNYLMSQLSVSAIPAADEDNRTGFYPERTATPIQGTDDGFALFSGSSYTGSTANILRAFAVARLQGYVAQTGNSTYALGRPFEFIVQQLVDGLVWAQNEGTYAGSWYYQPNQGSDMLGEYNAGVINCVEALQTAERFMSADGVIVPNLAKARVVQYLQQNIRACPGAGLTAGPVYGGAWMSSYGSVCDHALTAAHVITYGWVGANTAETNDSRLAFPGYPTSITRGQIRTWYNGVLNFISGPQFAASNSTSIGWDTGLVDGADFTRTDGRGNHWSMFHWATAARAVTPAIANFGNNDWERLFSTYFILNQNPSGTWNWVQGNTNSYSDNYCGEATRNAWALLTLSPDERTPMIFGSSSVATAPEGTAIDFSAKTNVAGTVVWAFGNGATANGGNVTYAYTDNGQFNATVTVTTAGGQVSTDTIQITITNAQPVVNAGADVSVVEGTPISLAGTFTDPGSGDTWTYQWQFGDATNAASQSVNKTYADDGVYTVQFRVTDDDGATATDTLTATVTNAPPVITSTPGTSATEGSAFSYTLQFTDKGTTDTHTCSAPVKPQGAALSGCAVSWTPTSAQAGRSNAFELCVADDDGASVCQGFSLTPDMVDTDSDLLPDAWETQHFGSLTAQSGGGDADGDGVSNRGEFLAGTDPSLFDGPSAPTVQSPACGSKVSLARPSVTVGNATHPSNETLTYDFELYADSSSTQLVASVGGLLSGTAATSWTVPFPLGENKTYFWRARAKDADTAGAWTQPTCAFTVNVADELPSAPSFSAPDLGGVVIVLDPVLEVVNAVDAEGDTLTYEFEVRSGDTVVASTQSVVEGNGTTSWQVTPSLAQGTSYRWRARARSAGGNGPWTPFGTFSTEKEAVVAQAPGVPVLLTPKADASLNTLTPLFTWSAPVHPDGLPMTYDLELKQGGSVVATLSAIGGTAAVLPEPLTDGASYTFRVRAVTAGNGPVGEFSAERAFSVQLPVEEPEPVPPASGCGCSAAPFPGALAVLLLGLARRRRQS